MSIIAINCASPSIFERAHTLLQRFLPTVDTQGIHASELKNLPDHLLLDIGIDPRNVPCSLDQVIARPDLAHDGVVRAAARTIAKS
ncbi:MAG: hypothetical protein WCC66_00610 [Rhizobiaceae bacterium]